MNRARYAILVCLNFLFLQFSFSQCPTGDVRLTSQAEVDMYSMNFPGCSIIHGKLIIGKFGPAMHQTDITDLSALSVIKKTNGLVVFNNPLLDDLRGLENLVVLNGEVLIQHNDELDNVEALKNAVGIATKISVVSNGEISDLGGLSGLAIEDGSLIVEDNIALMSTKGLDNIQALSELRIINNPWLQDLTSLDDLTKAGQVKLINLPALKSLKGLDNLTTVSSTMEIVNLSSIPNLVGLETLETVQDAITIALNDELAHLDGLGGLRHTNSLVVINNPKLKSLSAIVFLDDVRNLQIASNDILEELKGLKGITSLDNLLLLDNANLKSVRGLQNLTEIRINAQISQNPELTDLDGLSGLIRIQGVLSIVDNDKLTSIDGIEFATLSGPQIIVSDNDKLAVCDVPNVCEYVGFRPLQSYISNNDIGCESVAAVQSKCAPSAVVIEFEKFEAKKTDGASRITWEAVSEKNSRGFEIQRSQDGESWNTIAWVQSQGYSTQANAYEYVDAHQIRGDVYYRLVNEDIEGIQMESPIEKLNFGYVSSNLSVFPNPAKDKVTIEYQIAKEQTQEAVELRLYDLTGQLRRAVRSDQPGLIHLNVQGLPSGYYTLVVNGQTSKLVIGNPE